MKFQNKYYTKTSITTPTPTTGSNAMIVLSITVRQPNTNDGKLFVQGDIISLCITTDSNVTANGRILSSSIDYLTWAHTIEDVGIISQEANRSSNTVTNNVLVSINKQQTEITLIQVNTMLFPLF